MYAVFFPGHKDSIKLCKAFKSLKCARKYLFGTWEKEDDGAVQPIIKNMETKKIVSNFENQQVYMTHHTFYFTGMGCDDLEIEYSLEDGEFHVECLTVPMNLLVSELKVEIIKAVAADWQDKDESVSEFWNREELLQRRDYELSVM